MTDTTKYIHYDNEALLYTDSIIIRKRDMNLNVNGLYTVSNKQQYRIKQENSQTFFAFYQTTFWKVKKQEYKNFLALKLTNSTMKTTD